MVFGGVPYYWKMLDSELSLAQNIDKLCFNETGQLHDEYQALFKSLFSVKGKHREVIKALMEKRKGMQRKELAKATSIGNGKSLTKVLKELCECGFLRAYDNYKTSTNDKFYQIIDPFVLFAKACLFSSSFDNWSAFIGTPSYYSWQGHAFEIVCLNSMAAIKNALGISGVTTKAYSWRSQKSKPGAQIDLLIQRKDGVINVCEMKYSKNPYVISEEYEENLANKLQCFAEENNVKDQLSLTLVSFNGLKRNEHSDIIPFEVNGEDLFSK